MNVSTNAIDLICKYEGFRSRPYRDPVGIPTIGYGTTIYPDGKKVTMKDPPVFDLQARCYLLNHVMSDVDSIMRLVEVDLHQRQLDALVSFVYNVGIGAFKRSTLLRKLNRDPHDPSIEYEFSRWVLAGGRRLRGLVKRRDEEADLYFGYNT